MSVAFQHSSTSLSERTGLILVILMLILNDQCLQQNKNITLLLENLQERKKHVFLGVLPLLLFLFFTFFVIIYFQIVP